MKISEIEIDDESKKVMTLCNEPKDIYFLCGKLNSSYPTILQRVNILTSMGFLVKIKKQHDHKHYYKLIENYEI